MQTKATPTQSEAPKATAAAASVGITTNPFQLAMAEEQKEPLQMKTANEQLPPGYTRNPLQMRKPSNNPFASKPSTQNPLQAKTSTQNPLQPIKYSNPFQRRESSQPPVSATGNTNNPFQFMAPVHYPIQREAIPEEEPVLQPKKENNTGLPDNLKAGVEALSGYSMDDVKVHYNSDKPAQLQALAYAQDTNIHIAPGQEQHLPHEAWHVVQQKQGRVQPTVQMKQGISINDDKGLEKEADVKGKEAEKYSGTLLSGSFNRQTHIIDNPVQLISQFSKEVLEKVFIPLLQEESNNNRDLPSKYTEVQKTIEGFLMINNDVYEWQVAEQAITKFFDNVFGRYRLTLGLSILGRLNNRIEQMQNPNKALIQKKISELKQRMEQAVGQDGYVEIDPDTVDVNSPPPQPSLRGLIWNLHGFSNVINGEDRSDFKVTDGNKHGDRKSMVNELIETVGDSRLEQQHWDELKQQEASVMMEMWKVNADVLRSVASPLLTLEQVEAIYKLVRVMNEKFSFDFVEKVGNKYRVKDTDRSDTIKLLECYQQGLTKKDRQVYNNIDKLLNQLRSAEVVHKLNYDPDYISNLILSFSTSLVPQDGSEPALLLLISRVKELRQIIKFLSTFQIENAAHPLHEALGNLSKALNTLINRNDSEEYSTDDQNLAVYLDKELNKYAIVSHLTSLLTDSQMNLDFMLLNEMNRGITSFTDEVENATGKKYKVAQGPQMAAMSKNNLGTQREYYPLVYNNEKFNHEGYFYVGVKNGQTTGKKTKAEEEVPWMKPENKKKLQLSGQQVSQEYLDYRPIIVHRLLRKNTENAQDQHEIWLAAVHTTPYGTEFDRKKIFKELEGPLQQLKALADKYKAELIIGGDFYIAAEALVEVPQGPMFTITTLEKDNKHNIRVSPGDDNETRNLRNQKGEVASFTKHLSGDSDPGLGWKNPDLGIDLADVRSITGTNKNSKGLQSADYFVLPGTDKDRVRVGIIDPRTKAIVELETDEQQISKHNFLFSDHLISAIEKYETKEDKEKAQVHSRLKSDNLGMFSSNVEAIRNNPKSEKYDIGDFEPQPGVSSIITTILFQIWSKITTYVEEWGNKMDTSDNQNQADQTISPSDIIRELTKLLNWINHTRQTLKARFYDASQKENLSHLISVLQSANIDDINHGLSIIQDLINHFPDHRNTNGDKSFSDKTYLRTTIERKELNPHNPYPRFEELPGFASKLFNEDIKLIQKNDVSAGTEVLLQQLKFSSGEPVKNLVNALQKTKHLDEPEVVRWIGAAGLSVYLYELVFFQEEGKSYTNIFKHHYGRDASPAFRILYITSGLIQTPFIHSGYYLLG